MFGLRMGFMHFELDIWRLFFLRSLLKVHQNLFLQYMLYFCKKLYSFLQRMIFAPLSFCSLSEIKRNLLGHLKPKEGHHIKWGHVSSAAAKEIYQPILYPSIKRLTVHQKKETDLCNCCIGENCAENIFWKAFSTDKWKAQAEATESWCSACRRVEQPEQVKHSRTP